MDDSSVSIQKTLGIGTVSFDFDWDTVGPSDTDKVEITHVSGGGGCSNYTHTIVSSSSQLQTSLNSYSHSMSWDDQQCHTNCSFEVKVISQNTVAKSWGAPRTVKIKSCIGGL